jgi:uncharacterized glyoxalase superfamily protein PhnB
MKPLPTGWPRLSSALYCRDPAAHIDWLCRAFGFSLRLRVDDEAGQVRHSELCFGEALVMLGPEQLSPQARFGTALVAPPTAGGNTQTLMLYVDDVDAHCARARAAGAQIVSEPELHDYGAEHWADRSYGAIDPEGHLWWISQRMRG